MRLMLFFLALTPMISCATIDADNLDPDALDNETYGKTCQPDETRICVCEDRSEAIQECTQNGLWGKCDCPPGIDKNIYEKATDDPGTDHIRNSVVYANTKTSLYYIDPTKTNQLVWIGEFNGPCEEGSGLYDIAVDQDENIVGIAAEGLYSVDRHTAKCETIVEFAADAPHFFSLSYVKGVNPNDPNQDVLMAASVEEGQWVQIVPKGNSNDSLFISRGYHDPTDRALVSSGDIVSLCSEDEICKTYATIKCSSGYGTYNCESDWLAEIDPETGEATLIGMTGFRQIFGLGFWGDKVYGFTKNNEYLLIDTETGHGEIVTQYDTKQFWGAGSVTLPYISVI